MRFLRRSLRKIFKYARRLSGWGLLSAAICLPNSNAADSKPVIFRVLDPVRPDQTLLLFGTALGPQVRAEGVRLDDSVIQRPPATVSTIPANGGAAKKLEVLQASDLSVKLLIPKEWKEGVFAVRLKNANGATGWRFANRPALWWAMADGNVIRIFGLNLGPKPRVWLTGGKTIELRVLGVRENDITVEMPEGLDATSHMLWVHNGCGGMQGFGEPLPLSVPPHVSWPETMLDVRKFGAKGDNVTDDTNAIRQALAKATEAHGGIVFFPAGSYIVSGTLVVPKKTILRGEGRDKTWLKTRYRGAEFDKLIDGESEFAVEDLSIKTRLAKRVIACPYASPGSGGIRVERVRIYHLAAPSSQAETLVVDGPDCRVTDCVIVSAGMPFRAFDADRLVVRNNVILSGRGGWTGFWRLRNSVIEENEIGSVDLEGSYSSPQGSLSNVCFRANRFRRAWGGFQEAITFDTPYSPVWIGKDFLSHDGKIELGKARSGQGPSEPLYSVPLVAIIAGGKGVGQAESVTSIDGNVLALAHPFDVAPDKTSTLVVTSDKQHVIVVDNHFEDDRVAVQLYSQARDFFVARNRCERSGGSYALAGASSRSTPERYTCSFFNQWIDNCFSDGYATDSDLYGFAVLGCLVSRHQGPENDLTPAIGNRFVSNDVDAGTRLGLFLLGNILPTDGVPSGRDAIFEHNTVHDQPVGVSVGPGQALTLIRANRFQNVRRTLANEGRATHFIP